MSYNLIYLIHFSLVLSLKRVSSVFKFAVLSIYLFHLRAIVKEKKKRDFHFLSKSLLQVISN